MGCLLYELLTDKFLFFDPDWIKFFTRLTSNKFELILKKNKEAIGVFEEEKVTSLKRPRRKSSMNSRGKLTVNESILEFLESVLVRNPDLRPTVDHMERMFDSLLGAFILEDSDLTGNLIRDEFERKEKIHDNVNMCVMLNKVLKPDQVEILSSRDLYHYITLIMGEIKTERDDLLLKLKNQDSSLSQDLTNISNYGDAVSLN
jgi:serine/threonine protein kinase